MTDKLGPLQRRLCAPPPGGTAIRLAVQRMRQQRIGHKPFASPAATVRWFGAVQAQDDGIFHPAIVIDGQVAGTWSRELQKTSVAITCRPFARLDRRQSLALATAAERYARFLGLALARGRPSPPRGAPTR